MAYTSNPSTYEAEGDLCEFETILVYIGSAKDSQDYTGSVINEISTMFTP